MPILASHVTERTTSNFQAFLTGRDIERRIGDRFRRSSHVQLRRHVECECEDGVVTLRGRLPSFYLKQMAQTIALGVHGVEKVVNRIHVI